MLLERVSDGISGGAFAPDAAGAPPNGRPSERQAPPAEPGDSVEDRLAAAPGPAFAARTAGGMRHEAVAALADLRLMGGFVLRVDGSIVDGLPLKAQALLAFLATRPGRHVSREALADMLWTHSGHEQGRHSLRQALVVLRRSPAGVLLHSDANAVWIEVGTVRVDSLAMEAALVEGGQVALLRGTMLYRGAFLEYMPMVSPAFDDWAQPERERLADVAAEALRRLAEGQLEAGQPHAAAATAARLISLNPLDDAAHRLRMACLTRIGAAGQQP